MNRLDADGVKFPRVTVYLDDRNLELTKECSDVLAAIKTNADAVKFTELYGNAV